MNLLKVLKRLAVLIEKREFSLFSVPVEKQKMILASYPEPRSDIERSYYQYCCQMKLKKKRSILLINLASLPLVIFYTIKHGSEISLKTEKAAVFLSYGISEDVLPFQLKEEYRSWKILAECGEYITRTEKKYILELIRKYTFSWHFILKCLIKMRAYRYIIESYSPKAIVNCGEYSFTSSFMTYYCEREGVEHINVMHGEKLFYIRDSFFRFHRCFVWDEYYKKLFLQLRAAENQFYISVPKSILFDKKLEIEKEYQFTYYLGNETVEILEKIAQILLLLKKRGFKVAVRPHPRYSDKEAVDRIFQGLDCIEVPGTLDTKVSILRTQNAVSLYSTILNQALHNGTQIIIDDISDPYKFHLLDELGYIYIHDKKVKLLSEVVERGRNEAII